MFTPGRVRNPPNRFHDEVVHWEVEPPRARLEVRTERARSILSAVDAPDLGFRWSLNPYRGCTHGCAYCYARAYHEFLDLGAGTDFERRIYVKTGAPELLARAFERPSWNGELIAFSGATDCYQPLERVHEVTRRCLEVCARFCNPVCITTRSPLVVRDLDILRRLAVCEAVRVGFSIPLIERSVCRALEPGTASPSARLRAMRILAEAGIPVGVSVAPLIPGLNDHTLPNALRAAREAGARWATAGLLRLPGSVATVFEERLRRALPHRADAVLARLRRARGGALDGGRGTGPEWQATQDLFTLWTRRLGFEPVPQVPSPSPFRRPGAQLALWSGATGR